ncbi:hypothetical protein [Rhodoferax sp.]|nr:hypothetical protein [Rhodoferax sp.]MDD2808170.1 hypothetical protein [Rhodoferax sp.]MDD4944738.1 hypothetical protein [Rhodoferax sp.]
MSLTFSNFWPSLKLPSRVEFWSYRVGAYLLLHVLDDPAWLALMFC